MRIYFDYMLIARDRYPIIFLLLNLNMPSLYTIMCCEVSFNDLTIIIEEDDMMQISKDDLHIWETSADEIHSITSNIYLARFSPQEQYKIFLLDAITTTHENIRRIFLDNDILNIEISIPYPSSTICFQLPRVNIPIEKRLDIVFNNNKTILEELQKLREENSELRLQMMEYKCAKSK